MIKIKEYVKVKSLSEAYELNQKKQNKIIGGMMWLKMSRRAVSTAIDLSGLGLDKIEETETEFKIGCMVTLRRLETDERLNSFCRDAVRDAVKSIVGVQFRNTATLGGSLWGRYGFSDVLTVFMAMDSYVELYKGGVLPLKDFAAMKPNRDILVRLIVKKSALKCVYLSHRNTKTDFPVIALALACDENGICAAVGARPMRAVKIQLPENTLKNTENINYAADFLANNVKTGGNMRAGAEYRTHLIKVLTRRGLTMLSETGDNNEN